jgi:hypothetical protein
VHDKLPYVDNVEENMVPSPRAPLKYRMKKGITKVLIHWEGLSPADAT